jgi:hypothetical protein
MPNIPDDIYTEPEDFSPDTLANLGPLRPLAGEWQSDGGVDINPKADGPERRVYREHIRMEPIDPQPNGPQLLYGLRYHIHINTPEEDITFHDQVGYWLWEPATGLIMQSIAIPRGQVVLAGGMAKPGDKRISVEARRGDTRFGIPRGGVSHRLLPHRHRFQQRRKLDLRDTHGPCDSRQDAAIRSSRYEYAATRRGAHREPTPEGAQGNRRSLARARDRRGGRRAGRARLTFIAALIVSCRSLRAASNMPGRRCPGQNILPPPASTQSL